MNEYEDELNKIHTMNNSEALSLIIFGDNVDSKELDINLESIPEIIRVLKKIRIDLENAKK